MLSAAHRTQTGENACRTNIYCHTVTLVANKWCHYAVVFLAHDQTQLAECTQLHPHFETRYQITPVFTDLAFAYHLTQLPGLCYV